LKSLRKNCQRTIEDLEDAAQASDANRKQKLTELNDAFEQVFKAFHVLESEIAEVGETAVRIGKSKKFTQKPIKEKIIYM